MKGGTQACDGVIEFDESAVSRVIASDAVDLLISLATGILRLRNKFRGRCSASMCSRVLTWVESGFGENPKHLPAQWEHQDNDLSPDQHSMFRGHFFAHDC